MFNNFDLSDQEILKIIEDYKNLINIWLNNLIFPKYALLLLGYYNIFYIFC